MNDINEVHNVYDLLQKHFSENGWKYTTVPKDRVILIAFDNNNDHDKIRCLGKLIEEYSQFIFYSVCPHGTPESKRVAMAELLTRINANRVLGNFELDFDDGEIRYKTSLDYEGIELTTAKWLENLVNVNVTMMKNFLPAILNLINSDMTPLQVFNSIERIRSWKKWGELKIT